METLNVEVGDVEEWLERFQCWVSIQDAVLTAGDDNARDSRKVAFLLSCIGSEGYKILKAYAAPAAPNTMEFDALIKLLQDNLAKKQSVVSETYKFNCTKQETAESLSLYMSRLKLAASKCEYGTSFDRMVKDRFICGLRSEKLRAHLINDTTITTAAEAMKKAEAREHSDASAHSMASSVNFAKSRHTNQTFQPPNKNVKNKNSKGDKPKIVCSRCTLRGHVAKNCQVKCRGCHQIGHLKANCQRRRVNNLIDVVTDAEESDVPATNVQQSDIAERESHLWFVRCHEESGGNVNHGVINMHGACNCDTTCCCDNSLNYNGNCKFNSGSMGEPVREITNDSNITHDIVNEKSIFVSTNSNTNEENCMNIDKMHTNSNSWLHENVESISDLHDNFGNLSAHSKFGNIECINKVNHLENDPTLTVMLNDKKVCMEFDTGASVSIMSKQNFESLKLTGTVLRPCEKILMVANGQSVTSMFKCNVCVKFRDIQRNLCLYVVNGPFPTLLGVDWIRELFGQDWLSRVIQVNSVGSAREKVIQSIKTSKIFDPGLGKVTGFKAKLDLKADYRPKFCKARPVPFALKEPIGKELDRMERDGILVKTDSSEFASPIVPVVKSDKSLRLCGDYKTTLNPNIDTKVYPLPVVEECFSEMKGGVLFSKLDIKQAYNHVLLNDEDRVLTTINTHQGLYMWTRLPYGISSSSAIFQSIMDKVLQGMRGVTCRVDDILITGRTMAEHIERLKEVIRRLEEAGFRCKWDKSEFLVEKVIYNGYEVSKNGIRACRSKAETLEKAHYPTCLSELVAFLGAVQYYSRFIPQMATVVEPLNKLRRAKEWHFGSEEKESFDALKKLLMSDRVLMFYDPDLPLRVDCDASAYGLGAVLSHVVDSVDHPIEFISRTLSTAERNYSQIEKEALGIVWSIKRFHRYLYARPFELYTDHQPLEFILNPHSNIPMMAAGRIQRWALILSAYQYTIKFRPTSKHGNADVCSRYPLPETKDEVNLGEAESPFTIFSLYMDEDKPLLNSELIAKFTKLDPLLGKILYQVQEGWMDDKKTSKVSDEATSDKEYQALYSRRHELSYEQGCILWGDRVIVPEKLRSEMLKMLHATHMGMTMMKRLARNYVWWPGLDHDVEALVKQCNACQVNQRLPSKSVPHPWIPPTEPWSRIHLDFAGPFKQKMWLIVVDVYSKWLEVDNMGMNTKSSHLIKKLRSMFARFGLPKVLVSDNGPQLTSAEFKQFCLRNGINHIPTPAYHPSTNGQVEVYCGKFKRALEKMSMDSQDLDLDVSNWLLSYHNTPHSFTGVEPSLLMIGRRLRSAISLVHPLSNSRALKQQVKQEQQIVEGNQTLRRFVAGDKVLYRDVLHNEWRPGVIKNGSNKQYEVAATDGSDKCVWKHVDHIVLSTAPTQVNPPPIGMGKVNFPCPVTTGQHELSANVQSPQPSSMSTLDNNQILPDNDTNIINHSGDNSNTTEINNMINRPKRAVRPVDRLSYEKLGG